MIEHEATVSSVSTWPFREHARNRSPRKNPRPPRSCPCVSRLFFSAWALGLGQVGGEGDRQGLRAVVHVRLACHAQGQSMRDIRDGMRMSSVCVLRIR